jgi:hypothetical protein
MVSSLWGFLGISLVLLWVLFHSRSTHLLTVLVFIFLGGLDWLGTWLHTGGFFSWGDQIEWWAGFPRFQYSSNSTLLLWVPQHALSAWLATSLVAHDSLRIGRNRFQGAYTAFALAWSPFVALGLFPIAALAVIQNRFRDCLTFENAFLAPLFAVIYGSFYHSLGDTPPHGLLLFGTGEWQDIFDPYGSFVVLEFLLFFGVLFLAPWFRHEKQVRRATIAAVVLLLLIPHYHLGIFNDFAMRVSIPALCFLWAVVVRAVGEAANGGFFRLARAPIFCLCLLGAPTGASELMRSVKLGPGLFTVRNVAFESVPFLDKMEPVSSQYMGVPDSFFFKHLAK